MKSWSMKRRALAVAVTSIAVLSGCSGTDAGETVESAAGEASEAAEDVTEPSEPAAEPSDDAAAGGESGSTVLIGMVGTEDDPEAFEISLTTEDGEEVTSLPAGDYTIQVNDPSAMHNFHLTGGSVDESTSVPDTEETTFEVTLEAGEYTYKCDPHPPMTGTVTVT